MGFYEWTKVWNKSANAVISLKKLYQFTLYTLNWIDIVPSLFLYEARLWLLEACASVVVKAWESSRSFDTLLEVNENVERESERKCFDKEERKQNKI